MCAGRIFQACIGQKASPPFITRWADWVPDVYFSKLFVFRCNHHFQQHEILFASRPTNIGANTLKHLASVSIWNGEPVWPTSCIQTQFQITARERNMFSATVNSCFCTILLLSKGPKMSSCSSCSDTTGIMASKMFMLRLWYISMSFMDLSRKKNPNSLCTAAKPSLHFQTWGINRWALLAQRWVFQLKDVVTCVQQRSSLTPLKSGQAGGYNLSIFHPV